MMCIRVLFCSSSSRCANRADAAVFNDVIRLAVRQSQSIRWPEMSFASARSPSTENVPQVRARGRSNEPLEFGLPDATPWSAWGDAAPEAP